jgi:tripartite-type tricarboxylate transporter receptor subunit TctC
MRRRPNRREMITLLGTAAWPVAATLVGVGGGEAQTTRTIKFIVPVQSGGTLSILARLLAEQIARTQGTTIVVENRPGAGRLGSAL